jgi:hypothetical protein
MKGNILFYSILFFIFLVCLKIYYDSDAFQLKCIISSVDGNKYCVREREKLELAADLLANTTKKCKKLVEYLKEKFKDDSRVKMLVKGFNPQKINETLPTSELTAYSENKGEKLAFCLNTTKTGDTLIDPNTLMFVALHELSHIMTTSIGHKQDFWLNFKFLLENAKDINIYSPENYKQRPKEYCGMKITDNPYYDL